MIDVCTADRHDTLDAYSNHRCRCPEARRQKVLDWKRYTLRRLRGESLFTDSTGTVRRIQSLLALGWRYSDIAAPLGVTRDAVAKVTLRTTVHVKTAAAVRAVYDDLANRPGPSATTAARAARRGWLVPLWWDDDQIDDPAYDPRTDVIPDEVESRRVRRERRAAEVLRLTNRGLSAREIADRLHITTRQVVRDRHDAHQTDMSEATG